MCPSIPTIVVAGDIHGAIGEFYDKTFDLQCEIGKPTWTTLELPFDER